MDIYNIVRKAKSDFTNGNTTLGKYVTWSLHENIEKIDAYTNSKHISGDTDSLGREKPFFNINTAAVNIWYKATDIDRKDIKIKASRAKDTIGAFLLNIHLQEYMRKNNVGLFLNNWGRTLAKYGSAVIKFVEKDGELHMNLVPWNRLIVDSVDFYNNPVIERLFYTPSQLRNNKSYDQEKVKALLYARSTRKTMDDQQTDTNADYIELYEVHGEFPLSFITGKEKDDEEFVQQMHVISYVGDGKGGFDDFTLVSGREKKNPYMITHLIEEDGRVMAIGAVEHLFEAQWMVNHSVKAIKDQLDLASKLIFQTSDGSFVGQNVLQAIETGDIMIHSPNQPLTQIANNSHDITSLQNYSQQWQTLAQQITSTPDAISGGTMPSGTAYRQVAVLNQEVHNFFDMMIENKALYLEEMLRTYILPFLKTKFNTSEEISATLGMEDITKLDQMYIKSETNRIINDTNKQAILSGKLAEPMDEAAIQGQVKDMLVEQGNQRFIKPSEVETVTWNDMFKNLEYDVVVEITNEASNKAERLATLTELLQTIAKTPQILQDPNGKLFFNKILEESSVISPIQFQYANNQPAPTPAQTAQAIGGN
jgi:hypothetical protein